MEQALRQRAQSGAARVVHRLEVDEACEKNKRESAELAAWCRAEIARRANARGQRPAILKQLAGERKTTVQALRRVMRVFPA